MLGIGLALAFSKPHDQYGNASGEMPELNTRKGTLVRSANGWTRIDFGKPGGVELFTSVAGESGRNPGEKIEHDQAEIGVSVRVNGNWLGLQSRKPVANYGNANGEKIFAG